MNITDLGYFSVEHERGTYKLDHSHSDGAATHALCFGDEDNPQVQLEELNES